jgi:hypothetical protein
MEPCSEFISSPVAVFALPRDSSLWWLSLRSPGRLHSGARSGRRATFLEAQFITETLSIPRLLSLLSEVCGQLACGTRQGDFRDSTERNRRRDCLGAWAHSGRSNLGLLPMTPIAEFRPEESYGMAALFFAWQPMIALFIGWATSEMQTSVRIQGRVGWPEVRAPAPHTSNGLGRRAFLLLLAGLVMLSLTRIVPVRLRQAHCERVAAKKRETWPMSVDLP